MNLWTIISGILGILGFIVSLINVINKFLSNRINLELKIINCVKRNYVNNTKRILVQYQMNNKSKLPITVTDLQIVYNNQNYLEDYNTHEVHSYRHKIDDFDERIATYNNHLPINLPMLSSQAGYLVFVVPEDIAEDVCKDLTFQIRTNRCKEVQKKFSLNELVTIHHTLHKK